MSTVIAEQARETVSLGADIVTAGDQDLVQLSSRQSVWQRLESLREQHPYLSTVAETAVVWAGREAVTAVINANSSVRVGHGWKNSRFGRVMQSPAAAIAVGIVLSPYLEEYVCREWPSRHLDAVNRTGPQKTVGAAVAAVFAAGHAGKEAVPAPQFIGGLNYWRLQRNRGLKHAVLAHALHNGLAYSAAYLARRRHATSRD